MNQAKALYGKVDELTEGTLKVVPMSEKQVSKILDPSGQPIVTEVTKMVEKRVGQASVDITSLKKFADVATKESTELKGIGASEAGETLLNKIKQLNDNISFAAAQKLRSRLLDEEILKYTSVRDKTYTQPSTITVAPLEIVQPLAR